MSKIKWYAKSALNAELMKIKMDLGADAIEIQLLDELVNGRVGNYHNVGEVYDLEACKEIPVSVVHAPILGNYGLADVNIEDIVDSEDFKLFDAVCYIAEYFGRHQNHEVLVVFHSELDRFKMRGIDDTWKKVINGVGCMLFKYPHIRICLENITPIIAAKFPIHLSNNFKFDNVEMVKELRKQLNTDRVGTVLDTCHADISKIFMNAIYDIMCDREQENYDLEEYFRENKEVIELIHLSKTVGYGYGKGKHGQPFSLACAGDEDKVRERIDLYNKFGYKCPITLEVAETNYQISDGFTNSLTVCKKVESSL